MGCKSETVPVIWRSSIGHQLVIYLNVSIGPKIAIAPFGRLGLPQCCCHKCQHERSVLTAIALKSPPWHRHERARRSEARNRLRRVQSDLDRLERHHSQPSYSRLRRVMSQWSTDKWSGTYWGSSSRRRRAPKQNNSTKGKGKGAVENVEKETDHAKGLFPSYDKMQVGASSSSSAAVDGSAEAMQKAMKALIASNPSLSVPMEVQEALAFHEPMQKPAKDSLYHQQRMLNLRRKASNRVEKLQQALTRKGLQMTAYKEEMKQKLASELERFNKEKQEITKALEEARSTLAKIEAGEEPEAGNEDMGMETMNDGNDNLAQLLGLQEVDQQELERLKAEKTYAEAVAAQLQSQVQMMMQSATLAPSGLNQLTAEQVFGAGGRLGSPQMPGLGVIRPRSGGRPSPYNREAKDTKQDKEGEVETIVDSPDPLTRMDQ